MRDGVADVSPRGVFELLRLAELQLLGDVELQLVDLVELQRQQQLVGLVQLVQLVQLLELRRRRRLLFLQLGRWRFFLQLGRRRRIVQLGFVGLRLLKGQPETLSRDTAGRAGMSRTLPRPGRSRVLFSAPATPKRP